MSPSKEKPTVNLSAMGSRIFPSTLTWLNFRAAHPSKKSVKAANTQIMMTNARLEMKNAHNNTGDKNKRIIVKKLAIVIFLSTFSIWLDNIQYLCRYFINLFNSSGKQTRKSLDIRYQIVIDLDDPIQLSIQLIKSRLVLVKLIFNLLSRVNNLSNLGLNPVGIGFLPAYDLFDIRRNL